MQEVTAIRQLLLVEVARPSSSWVSGMRGIQRHFHYKFKHVSLRQSFCLSDLFLFSFSDIIINTVLHIITLCAHALAVDVDVVLP